MILDRVLKKRVLIVDDNLHFKEAFRFLLEANFDEKVEIIHEASNAEKCMEILKQYPIDIVFMDIEMPGISGIETTKLIINNFRDIKVIAVTFHNEDDYLVDMIEAGARGFISKSKINKELIEEVLV